MKPSHPLFSNEFVSHALKAIGTVNSFPNDFTGATRVWTDSRSLQAGDLFVAIRGDQFDGHAFVKAAADAGASGAIIEHREFQNIGQIPPTFPLFTVNSSLEAIRALAKAHRERLAIPIFAVGGSNGKTTTKEWLAYLLKALHGDQAIFKTAKSQNSILGIAMSLLQIRSEHFAVIEIGIDEPGWMQQHLDVVQPTHGLLTTIAEEHLNRLESIEKIAEEELKLLHYLRQPDRSFAANVDCPWISKALFPTDKCLTYSLEAPAEIEGKYVAPQILHAFGFEFKNPLPGAHNAQNLLAALAGVRLLHPDLNPSMLLKLASKSLSFEGEPHRSRWISTKSKIQIFDDCYNANPDSMEKALKTFLELSKGCIQHIVMGDMLDLGASSTEAHRRILNLALVLDFDHIYLLGTEFKKAAEAQLQAEAPMKCFQKIEELSEALTSRLQPGDAVFLKGSRGMKLERVLESIQPAC